MAQVGQSEKKYGGRHCLFPGLVLCNQEIWKRSMEKMWISCLLSWSWHRTTKKYVIMCTHIRITILIQVSILHNEICLLVCTSKLCTGALSVFIDSHPIPRFLFTDLLCVQKWSECVVMYMHILVQGQDIKGLNFFFAVWLLLYSQPGVKDNNKGT